MRVLECISGITILRSHDAGYGHDHDKDKGGAYVGLNYLCGPDLGHLIQAFGDNHSTVYFSYFAFFLIEVLYPA